MTIKPKKPIKKFDVKVEIERINKVIEEHSVYLTQINGKAVTAQYQTKVAVDSALDVEKLFIKNNAHVNEKLEIAFDRLAQVESACRELMRKHEEFKQIVGSGTETLDEKLSEKFETITKRLNGLQQQINQTQGNLPDDVRRIIAEIPEFRWPSHVIQRGCVCPVGAEQNCKNYQCGRK